MIELFYFNEQVKFEQTQMSFLLIKVPYIYQNLKIKHQDKQ